jgi:uncharacterized protein (TIGR00730 family)
MMKRICVYCGSSVGSRPEYTEAARALGHAMVTRGIGLVYGGGNIGIMNVLARTLLAGGGEVIGVIPKDLLNRGLALKEVTELRVVETMHVRKAMMADLANAFIALPGGLGTIEELLEIWTWAQLGIHTKPCGLLNTCGYFDHLIRFIDHAVGEQFIEPVNRDLLIVDTVPETLLARLKSYKPPAVNKVRRAERAADRLEA